MRVIEKTGKTVEEAVNFALQELQVSKDSVEVEILNESSKGLFGIFGSKEYTVRVSVKNGIVEGAIEFLKNVFDAMNLEVEIDSIETADSIEITLDCSKNGILIGRRGETLDALQYLTSIAVNKGDKEFKRIILDSENYRQKRKDTLISLGNKLAAQVARERKSITLEPMNSHERRIIHAALQNNKYVETTSIGEDPNRRLVISYKKGV